MIETIAMVATIIFCINGGVKDGKCPDGSEAQKREIKLLSSNGNLVEIRANDNIMFELRFDGSTFADLNFKVDEEALKFWQALGDQLPNVCVTLPAILEQKR